MPKSSPTYFAFGLSQLDLADPSGADARATTLTWAKDTISGLRGHQVKSRLDVHTALNPKASTKSCKVPTSISYLVGGDGEK